ncbi:MAG: arginine--tRNA ligase [bacterium]
MFKDLILDKVNQAIVKAGFDGSTEIALRVETPKNAEFGDFAVNVSPFAKVAKMAPPLIAQKVVDNIDFEGEINIIGGFINFKLTKEQQDAVIKKILQKKENFGSNNFGQGEKVILEYVSANPTGPFHIGHGRWAAMGSALASVMKFSGYDVFQEFYINDAGNQIKDLANALYIRVLQELGEDANFPADEVEVKNYYTGDYLVPVAKKYVETQNKTAEELDLQDLGEFAKAELFKLQKDLLENFGVNFDNFYSESSLHNSGEVEKCVKQLKENGKVYEKEGAVWFKSSEYGDEQDRVIKKADGSNTYLTADIAYHNDKLLRGFDRMINIWGADHHGYVARMRASIEALGYDGDKLEVLLGQLVNLIINGEQTRMGKRKKMLTLGDLIDEVGVDATRFWMIMRSIDTTLDFDVDLAKSSNDENPVFYVQYAHARACSILRAAVAERFDTENKTKSEPFFTKEELDSIAKTPSVTEALSVSYEKSIASTKALIMKLESFEEIVLLSVKARAPYMLCRYAQELAADFHQFYAFSRVLNVEAELMKSRLALVFAFKQVLATTLGLLGVSAPESM